MADIADTTTEQEEFIRSAEERAIRARAADMEVGEAGACGLCGEEFSRIVRGNCAGCRDKHGLP